MHLCCHLATLPQARCERRWHHDTCPLSRCQLKFGRSLMPAGTASGPVRGLATLEPFALPPCGIHVDKPRGRARTASELREQGCTPAELRMEWGFSAFELARAGLTALEQRSAGVPTREIAYCRRYTASQCREAGCTALDMFAARFSVSKLLEAGFTPADFVRAGLTTAAIRALGFSEAQMAEAGAADAPAFMAPPPSAGGPAQQPRQTGRPSSAMPATRRPRSAARPRSSA